MALRWLIAVLATIATFLVTWVALALGGVDPNITFSIAGLLSSAQGGFLYWWAGREEPRRPAPGAPESPVSVLVGEIPQRPNAFQSRPGLYRHLIESGGVQVLTGARGVGKTQLAAAYARKCIAEHWPVVAWISAEEPGQVLAGMARLAEELGLRHATDDAEEAARSVRRWLETQAPERCLVVFDNADQPDELRRWLPAGGTAQIVITSNDRAFEAFGTPVDVGVFAADEALAFLRERTGLDDDEGAGMLAAELGHLPIALAQSAAVIRRQVLTYRTFLRRLLELPIDEYLAPLPGDPYPHGAAHAALLSIVAVSAEHPLSRPLADLLGVLSPSGVDRELLYEAARQGLLTAGGDPASDHEVDAALGVLRESACLVTFSVDGQAVIMHRFTQRVVRDCARRTGTLSGIVARATRLLSGSVVPADQAWDRRTEGAHLIQQVAALCDAASICRLHHDSASVQCDLQNHSHRTEVIHALLALRRWSVRHLYRVSDLRGAIDLGELTLSEHETLLSPDHPDTLELIEQLGTAYQHAEEFARAVELFERSYAERQRTLPPDDLCLMAVRQELACALQEAGRVAEAISLYEHVLEDRQRLLGTEHPETLTARYKLAYALRDAGRLAESIGLYEQTLADRTRVLGPDDPATVTARGRLAQTYQIADRIDDAITNFEQAAADRARILGPDHPLTLQFSTELAGAYQAADRQAEAIAMYESTLDLSAQALGGEHPLTRKIRQNLTEARSVPQP